MIPLANVQTNNGESEPARPENVTKRRTPSTSDCPPAFNIDSERVQWDRSRTSSLSSDPGKKSTQIA